MRRFFLGQTIALILAVALCVVGCGSGSGSGDSSDDTKNRSQQVQAGIDKYESELSSGATKTTAVSNTANWFKSQEDVIDAYPTEDGGNIIIRYNSRFPALLNTETFDNGSQNASKASTAREISNLKTLSIPVTGERLKAIIMDPFNFTDQHLAPDNAGTVRTVLSQYPNADITFLKGSQVTPELFESLNNYDIIYYIGHGGIDHRNGDIVYIGTGVPYSKINDYKTKYNDSDKYLGEVAPLAESSTIGINSNFIRDHAKGLKATVVYLDACNTLAADKNDSMASAFIYNGAKSYLGWGGGVGSWLVVDLTAGVAENFFEDLLICKSVSTAFDSLPFDYNKADLHYRGNGKLPICDIESTTYSISGTISTGGIRLAGVTISTAAGSTQSDSSGNYTLSNLSNGTYTVIPAKTGYSFYPVQQTIVVNGANVTGQNFIASPKAATFRVTGTIHAVTNSGPALSGAVVSLAGKQAITDSNGSFVIDGIPPGLYELAVSKAGYQTYYKPSYAVNSDILNANYYLAFNNSSLTCVQNRSSSTNGIQFNGQVEYVINTITTLTWGVYHENLKGMGPNYYSGSIRARLWAVPYSFSGGTLNGFVIGTFTPNFTGSSAFTQNQLYVNGYTSPQTTESYAGSNPPTGNYCIVATIEEFDSAAGCASDGYCYTQWIQFSGLRGFL